MKQLKPYKKELHKIHSRYLGKTKNNGWILANSLFRTRNTQEHSASVILAQNKEFVGIQHIINHAIYDQLQK